MADVLATLHGPVVVEATPQSLRLTDDGVALFFDRVVRQDLPGTIGPCTVEVLRPVQAGRGLWLVREGDAAFTVEAAGLRIHRERPGLLEPLVAGFRPPPLQAAVGRGLLRLLRLPGLVGLLTAWHRSRTRPRTAKRPADLR